MRPLAFQPTADWPLIIKSILRDKPSTRLRSRTEWIKQREQIYYDTHRDKILRSQQDRTEVLSDGYVRTRLSEGTKVPAKQWPVQMVEAHRVLIKLKREVKRLGKLLK